VQTHADTYLLPIWPVVGREGDPGGNGGSDGVACPSESDKEGISLGVDLLAARLLEGLPEEPLLCSSTSA
jgi:hypothetical protein